MSSGQLELFGNIAVEDWQSIRNFLNNNESLGRDDGGRRSRTPEKDNDGWGNDWNWEEDNSSATDENDKEFREMETKAETDENWLEGCKLAHSPMADVFVIGKQTKAVFLISEWGNNKMKYTKSFEGVLSQEEGEILTSITCVPLISKKKTSPGAPDWTCILVGFNSGYVRMYTEKGNILVNQLFHNQQVQSFKIRSFQPASTPNEHDQLEELIIFYQNVIVTLDGFGIFQTLRACRSQLARLQANAADTSTSLNLPPLTYKKWQLDNVKSAVDCESVGLKTPSTFDHLYNGSILGGLNAKGSRTPATSNIFISAGRDPYLSFHFAQENQAAPVLTELASAVASKLKSSLLNAATGWLGFGRSENSSKTKEEPKIEPPTSMASRFGFKDSVRNGALIAMSPCRKFSAVTDNLGRVVLFDNDRGLAVRIWKGYRDAQCSWLVVEEKISSRHRAKECRSATFLVIYARRRGQLEVYSMQQGPKIAAFSVSKIGQLLSTTYGMMGLSNIPIRGGNRPTVYSIFIDHDAQLYTLNIPFHLALDKASTKMKDLHLLKSLQKVLRRGDYSSEDLLETLKKIKGQSAINQAFRLLTQKCSNHELFSSTLDNYLEAFCEDGEKDLSVPFQVQSLLELYLFLIKAPTKSVSNEIKQNEDNSFHSTGKELKCLEQMWIRFNSLSHATKKGVKFADEKMSVNEYFSCCMVEFDPAKVTRGSVNLTLNLKCDFIENFGNLLLRGCINDTLDLCEWRNLIRNAALNFSQLLWLTFKFWCKDSIDVSSYLRSMSRLYEVVKLYCESEGYEKVTSDFNKASNWWEDIRKELTSCPEIFQVYSFTIVCRAVSLDFQIQSELSELEKKQEIEEEDAQKPVLDLEATSSEWENISLDCLRWNILLKQTEDLFVLSEILMTNPKLNTPALPVLHQRIGSLSVVDLLDKGKGCIAEVVGKWLTTIGVDPNLISNVNEHSVWKISPEKLSISGEKEDGSDIAVEMVENICFVDDEKTREVLELVTTLERNFSVSLTSSIVLINYCWEYCLEWNKSINHLEYLDAAVKCATSIVAPTERHGIMNMVWNTFLCDKLKSDICERPTGGDTFSSLENRGVFMRTCVLFLNSFMDANVQCEAIPFSAMSKLKSKSHWSNDASSSASLNELATTQPRTDYEMIFLHYQLLLCAHLALFFRVRKSSLIPVTKLFDTQSRSLFFQSLSSMAPHSTGEIDLALKNRREEFLAFVISGAIRSVPEEDDSSACDENDAKKSIVVPSPEGVQECNNWIQKSFELGRIWRFDLDGLRIVQVCEFYSNGLDRLGLESIAAVHSKDILGTKLLVIAGMRISYLMNQNQDDEKLLGMRAGISTNLSSWLHNIEYSILRCLRFSKESIVDMTQQIIHMIPESSYDYKLAEELFNSSLEFL